MMKQQHFPDFISQLVREKMSELHIPGAAVVVVKDGQILLAEGYGYANVAEQRCVDVNHTLFRIASVSKVFTILAVLQLAEKGKIDLEAPTNTYLKDFQIQNKFATPQCVKHLLTHSEGFETRLSNMNALDYSAIPSLAVSIPRIISPLFTEPGSMITYGATGMAVLSYIVEQVSGLSFEEYVTKNILQPLRMEQSTCYQNFSSEQLAKLAAIYLPCKKQPIPLKVSYSVFTASGGISVVPIEMANLMLALLQLGQFQNQIIAKTATIKSMLTHQFANAANIPGVTYGFFENEINCIRVLQRDGSGFSINSRIVLWPEHNMGMFIVANSAAADLCIELTRSCTEFFFPGSDEEEDEKNGNIDLQAYCGIYQMAQYSRTTSNKIMLMFMGQLVIDKGITENELTISPLTYDPMSEIHGKTTWRQTTQQGLFKGLQRKAYMLFQSKLDKNIQLASGTFYHSTYEKIRWYQNPKLSLLSLKIFSWLFWLLAAFSFIGSFGNPYPGCAILALSFLISIANAFFAKDLFAMIFKKGLINNYPSIIYIDAPRLLFKWFLPLPIISCALFIIVLLGLIASNEISAVTMVLSILTLSISGLYYWFLHYWKIFIPKF